MMFVGIDPDLHNLGFALVDAEGHVLKVNVVRVPKSFKGEEAVAEMISEAPRNLDFWVPEEVCRRGFTAAIEGQQIYYGKSQVRPDSLLLLAQVAGAAACAMRICGASTIILPRPRKWKGEVPKPIHQARILSRLGWAYKKTQGYSYPTDPPKHLGSLRPEEWKHVVDAIGLALWARDRAS